MSFGPEYFDVPFRLFNYDTAVRHEANVKPIRGRPDCKPIGKRRKTHATIRREGDVVLCRLYNTDLVSFYPDGRIVMQFDGWTSLTTRAFVNEVTGAYVFMQHGTLWVKAWVNDKQGAYCLDLARGAQNVFSYVDGRMTFHNPQPVTVHSVARKAANSVRRQYKAFKDYVINNIKLREDGSFSEQEFKDIFGDNLPPVLQVRRGFARNAQHIAEFLELARSSDHEAHYRACLWLAYSYHPYFLRANTLRIPADEMLKELDTFILYHHRDECFVERLASMGVATKDAYAKYF
jgi:hypothetical protein